MGSRVHKRTTIRMKQMRDIPEGEMFTATTRDGKDTMRVIYQRLPADRVGCVVDCNGDACDPVKFAHAISERGLDNLAVRRLSPEIEARVAMLVAHGQHGRASEIAFDVGSSDT